MDTPTSSYTSDKTSSPKNDEPILNLSTLESQPLPPPSIGIDESTLVDEDSYPPVWKQWCILVILDLALMVDVISGSALFVILSHTAKDLNISTGNISWILTAYSISFASFQLSAGRLADLTSAGWVFVIGIGGVAVLNLILSFLNNGVIFLVLRAVQGIAAAMTIPSAYNITVRTFPEGERRNRAIAILGVVGSVSFSIGVIIGGCFEAISWRWLFRLISILSFLTVILSVLFIPKSRTVASVSWSQILIRMDPFGLLLSVGGVVFLVLALTSGPELGWGNPRFYVPLPLSLLLLVAFFLWEAKGRTVETAMLPAEIWRVSTLKPLVFMGLSPFIFWGTCIFGYPNYWQTYLSRTSIESAIRLLPIGIAAFAISIVVQVYPRLLIWRRWPIFVGAGIAAGMEILFVFSGGGGSAVEYWGLCLVAFLIGSACSQFVWSSISVLVVTSVKPRQAGVVGGLLSVVSQLGNVVGLAIQAACLGHLTPEHPVHTWSDYATGFWAVFGWLMGATILAGTALYFELKRRRESPPPTPFPNALEEKRVSLAETEKNCTKSSAELSGRDSQLIEAGLLDTVPPLQSVQQAVKMQEITAIPPRLVRTRSIV